MDSGSITKTVENHKVLVTAGGKVTISRCSHKYTLDDMQDVVGGYVQMIGSQLRPSRLVMILNEEGKIMGKRINEIATAIAHTNLMIHDNDNIVGDVLLGMAQDGDIWPLDDAEMWRVFEIMTCRWKYRSMIASTT